MALNREAFSQEFEKLVDAFGANKPGEKARIYYEKIKHCDYKPFRRAVDDILTNSERFPTIARLLQAISSYTPKNERQKANCNVCNGFGWVQVGYELYRGDCPHGQELSSSIPTCPREEGKIYVILHEQHRTNPGYYKGVDFLIRMKEHNCLPNWIKVEAFNN